MDTHQGFANGDHESPFVEIRSIKYRHLGKLASGESF
jgi:hypothetical protein